MIFHLFAVWVYKLCGVPSGPPYQLVSIYQPNTYCIFQFFPLWSYKSICSVTYSSRHSLFRTSHISLEQHRYQSSKRQRVISYNFGIPARCSTSVASNRFSLLRRPKLVVFVFPLLTWVAVESLGLIAFPWRQNWPEKMDARNWRMFLGKHASCALLMHHLSATSTGSVNNSSSGFCLLEILWIKTTHPQGRKTLKARVPKVKLFTLPVDVAAIDLAKSLLMEGYRFVSQCYPRKNWTRTFYLDINFFNNCSSSPLTLVGFTTEYIDVFCVTYRLVSASMAHTSQHPRS